jgi:hypothetical protein
MVGVWPSTHTAFWTAVSSGVADMETDLSYYRHRASKERAAAASSANGNARAAHLELARRYDERVELLAAESSASRLHLLPAA